jgi:NAD(P)-dependent dehydrogenase (short-subunit alcohol dehydrogenase family)
MRAERWDAHLRANLGALFCCTHRAATSMARRGIRGSITNVSTNGAARAHRHTIADDATKGAMDSFTGAVAVDLGPWCNGSTPSAPARS